MEKILGIPCGCEGRRETMSQVGIKYLLGHLALLALILAVAFYLKVG